MFGHKHMLGREGGNQQRHTPSLSIIIPVYNVAPYLHRCLDSIIAQCDVISDFEMILVDDGSTDESGKICDEYSKYEFIEVIHKENEGLGYARNTGLDAARGEYVFFVDSDDSIPEGTLAYLIDIADRYDTDIISFPFRGNNPDGTEFFIPSPVGSGEYTETLVVGSHDILHKYVTREIHCSAWTHWFKRKIFENERFSNVPLHEDSYSMFIFLSKADTLLVTNRVCYDYFTRYDSLSNSEITENNLIAEISEKRLIEFLDSNPEFSDLHPEGVVRLMAIQLTLLQRILNSRLREKFIDEIVRIRREVLSEAVSIEYKLLSKGLKINIILLKISDKYCRIYFFLHRWLQNVKRIMRRQ